MNDSIPIIEKAVSSTQGINTSVSIWFWIAVIELILIVWLLLKIQKQRKKKMDLWNVKKSDLMKSGNVDMTNLVNSIHHSRELYKELSSKCHPDRFVNMPEQKIAEELFQRISKNKRNYEQLVALKAEAIEKLNIKF
jgi:hypothetical protein